MHVLICIIENGNKSVLQMENKLSIQIVFLQR